MFDNTQPWQTLFFENATLSSGHCDVKMYYSIFEIYEINAKVIHDAASFTTFKSITLYILIFLPTIPFF